MSIVLDGPAGRTPSVTRSALLRRKIRGRCVRLSVSSAAGSYGKKRKVSITISLRRHAKNRAGEHESRGEGLSRGYQEILPVEAATPRTARSGGVSGMLHRTTVRRADLIEGTVDSLVRNRGPISTSKACAAGERTFNAEGAWRPRRLTRLTLNPVKKRGRLSNAQWQRQSPVIIGHFRLCNICPGYAHNPKDRYCECHIVLC